MYKARLTTLLIVLAIMALTLGAAVRGVAEDQTERKLHPALRWYALEKPNETVEVLVQVARGERLESYELPPGTQQQKYHAFINTHRLKLPVEAVTLLANHPRITYISPNATLQLTNTLAPVTAYPYAAQIHQSWWPAGQIGSGIGVAVVDSGVASHPDFGNRKVDVVVPEVNLGADDLYGHGTHVAGVIAGRSADDRYVGIAPGATIYNIKSSSGNGQGREGDLINALEWIFNNHAQYNIRVVNISAQSSVAQSYLTAPLSAAVEQLWLQGVVVVVSAGNRGAVSDAMYYPPSNDPYVITVGAVSDAGTPDRADDYLLDWSSRGTSQDGFVKPDVLAPGHRITAPLSATGTLATQFPDRVVDGQYISLSGTSMAAPVVSGAAAVMLSYMPELTPDQVKWLITAHTGNSPTQGMLDTQLIYQAMQGQPVSAISRANAGLIPNNYLNPDTGGLTDSNVFFDNVFFDNVFFDNVFFDNVQLD